MEVIKVNDLTKKYKNKVALSKVNINISKGEIVGLLGHNGAGKTTLIKCITGLLKPQDGCIKIFDYNLSKNYYKIINKIGLLLEPTFYDHLTAFENLKILMIASGNYNLKKIQEIMEFVGLWHVKNDNVTSFSFGMKQRLGLAQALMNDPEILILDEPTVGLDPIGIKEFKEKLIYLSNNKGISILFSSHQLSDIQEICNRVVLLENGEVLYDDVVDSILNQKEYYLYLDIDDDKNFLLSEYFQASSVSLENSILTVKTKEDLDMAIQELYNKKIKIMDIEVKKGSLLNLFYGK